MDYVEFAVTDGDRWVIGVVEALNEWANANPDKLALLVNKIMEAAMPTLMPLILQMMMGGAQANQRTARPKNQDLVRQMMVDMGIPAN